MSDADWTGYERDAGLGSGRNGRFRRAANALRAKI